jgi:hypothetical protein
VGGGGGGGRLRAPPPTAHPFYSGAFFVVGLGQRAVLPAAR